MYVHVEPIRGSCEETQVGRPDFIHKYRVSDLQHGEMYTYCISNAIMLKATGERNSPEQDTHTEHMTGVLKYMPFYIP